MEPFRTHIGVVAPLDAINVDTDQIIPKQFLKRIERTGFGQYLFFDWRFRDDGSPKPDFVLNQPLYEGASILLSRRNFGCGSSREHAPWALLDYGFHAVIAPSFGDIFRANSFKNGILPLVLPEDVVDRLFQVVNIGGRVELKIDLERQIVVEPDGTEHSFEVDMFRRQCLLDGLDDIGWTLQYASEIEQYELHRDADPT